MVANSILGLSLHSVLRHTLQICKARAFHNSILPSIYSIFINVFILCISTFPLWMHRMSYSLWGKVKILGRGCVFWIPTFFCTHDGCFFCAQSKMWEVVLLVGDLILFYFTIIIVQDRTSCKLNALLAGLLQMVSSGGRQLSSLISLILTSSDDPIIGCSRLHQYS